MNKIYLQQGKWRPHRVPKCPKCGNEWFTRIFYLEESPGEAFTEYNGLDSQIEIDRSSMTKSIRMTCLRCKDSFFKREKIYTEQDVIDAVQKVDLNIVQEQKEEKTLNSVKIENKEESIEDAIRKLEEGL